jgi:hypothetical protein
MDTRTCRVCGATSSEEFCSLCGSQMPAQAENGKGQAASEALAHPGVVRLEKPGDRVVRLEKPGDRVVRLEEQGDRVVRLEKPGDRVVRLEKPGDRAVRLEKPSDKAIQLGKRSDPDVRLEAPRDPSQGAPNPVGVPTGPRSSKRGLVLGAAAIVVLAGIVWAVVANLPANPSALPPSATTLAPAPRATSTSVATGRNPDNPSSSIASQTSAALTTEDLARQQLNQEVQLYGVTTDNHYLVELAAKWVGATDPQLTAANGSHTFYASDILTEYRTIKALYGSSVHLVLSSQFGKQTVNSKIPAGEPLYVTVYDPGTFAGKDSAASWCSAQFPAVSGASLDNLCLVRPASPPHN